jgi:hypothetical protein
LTIASPWPTMPAMNAPPNDTSRWDHYRSDLEHTLSRALDEESLQALQSLPVSVGPELFWRLNTLHAQMPSTGGTISFNPIRTHPSPGAQDQACGLCGDPFSQILTAQSTQRFRCELCAIAARLLLGYPVLYERSRESLLVMAT